MMVKAKAGNRLAIRTLRFLSLFTTNQRKDNFQKILISDNLLG